MSRALRFAPLVLLAILLAGLVWRLATPVDTTVSSKLEGQPVPQFALPLQLQQQWRLGNAGDAPAGEDIDHARLAGRQLRRCETSPARQGRSQDK